MAFISNVLNEKQLLCCLFFTPGLVEEVETNYFITAEGRDLYGVFKELRGQKVTPTIPHLVSEGNKRNAGINEASLQELFSCEYEISSFPYYHLRLRQDYAKWHIENSLLKDILVNVSHKGELNVDKLRGLIRSVNDHLELIEGRTSLLITPAQLMSNYEAIIQSRIEGMANYDIGDSAIDKILTAGVAPGEQTTIFGDTGMGKSMVALNWFNKQINKQIPAMMVNMEMSLTATTDRLFALRNSILMSQLLPRSGGTIDQWILTILEKEKQRFNKMNSFFVVDETNLYFRDLRPILREAKARLRSDYVLCTIDLWSMIKDVAGQDAGSYEEGMNISHTLAKEEGVHLINVVQMKRGGGDRPATLDAIKKLRPALDRIKNSGAIAERSRNVFGVYREKHYAKQFFPDHAAEVDLMDDIVEVQNLKQSNGGMGDTVRYRHNGGTFRLTRIAEEDAEEMAKTRERVSQIISAGRTRTKVTSTEEAPASA